MPRRLRKGCMMTSSYSCEASHPECHRTEHSTPLRETKRLHRTTSPTLSLLRNVVSYAMRIQWKRWVEVSTEKHSGLSAKIMVQQKENSGILWKRLKAGPSRILELTFFIGLDEVWKVKPDSLNQLQGFQVVYVLYFCISHFLETAQFKWLNFF